MFRQFIVKVTTAIANESSFQLIKFGIGLTACWQTDCPRSWLIFWNSILSFYIFWSVRPDLWLLLVSAELVREYFPMLYSHKSFCQPQTVVDAIFPVLVMYTMAVIYTLQCCNIDGYRTWWHQFKQEKVHWCEHKVNSEYDDIISRPVVAFKNESKLGQTCW